MQVSRRRPIRTLLAMACDGVGPSATCINLMSGAHLAGFACDVFATHRRTTRPPVPVRTPVPLPLAYLPYRWIADRAHRQIERDFLAAVRPGDIAYLWPAASLETHRILHDRGIPMVSWPHFPWTSICRRTPEDGCFRDAETRDARAE